ncbi:MAG: hypothetical protein H6839_07690 [Planctomycetes bacterium]|nr:hypothetical protein [Planctomycetota bacterium]
MSAIEPIIITGRDALEGMLGESGVHVARTNTTDVRQRAPKFFQQLKAGEPNVVVIDSDGVASLDVMSLRWMFPAGVTPLVLVPSNPQECAELAQIAATAARLIPGPVFILLEDPVADAEAIVGDFAEPELALIDPPPLDAAQMDEEEAELQMLSARLATPIRGLKAAALDPCPSELGKPEWLVISFGETSQPAAEAVRLARADGQRVNHLRLRQLWPLPEADILRHLMGIKHVVMAERNLGQYALEIRRIAPEMPVVPAGRATGAVTSAEILRRLQTTPRCC